jgi:acetyltransferase-like isoleucine patch superfamily enzyme
VKYPVKLNNSPDPAETRNLRGDITGSTIGEIIAVFTPLYNNYGKNTGIGKNVFIGFGCVFLEMGGITSKRL